MTNSFTRRSLLEVLVGSGISVRRRSTDDTPREGHVESWAQFCYDSQNSGYAPENRAPEPPIEPRWRWIPNEGESVASGPSIRQQTVAVSGGPIGTFAAADGTVQWEISDRGRSHSTPVFVGDTVLFAWDLGVAGEIRARSVQDGSEQWVVATKHPIRSPITVADSTIYAGSYDREGQTGTVHALSVENGSERWRTTGIEINKSGLAVDETTVYASGKQHVYALSREDGRERWRTKVDGLVGQGDDEPNHLESAPAVANGTCYVGTKDGRLRALSTENGNELWSANVCESIISSPAVDESKVYVSGWLGTVVAVSRSNGNTQWSREITGTLFGSPAIVDSTLFVPSVTGGLHAFATDDGTKRWQFNTTNALMGPPAVADGTVYVVDENGRLLALSHSESDGLFGIGLLDDPLPIGVGAGIAGMAIATMYKLYKDVTGNQSENDDTDRH